MIIGYTSGVYDLFRIGHLNLLKNVKKMLDATTKIPSADKRLTCFSIIGYYFLAPSIFHLLHTTKSNKRNEIQITNVLLKQVKASNVIALKLKRGHFGCGSAKRLKAKMNFFHRNLYTATF